MVSVSISSSWSFSVFSGHFGSRGHNVGMVTVVFCSIALSLEPELSAVDISVSYYVRILLFNRSYDSFFNLSTRYCFTLQ